MDELIYFEEIEEDVKMINMIAKWVDPTKDVFAQVARPFIKRKILKETKLNRMVRKLSVMIRTIWSLIRSN